MKRMTSCFTQMIGFSPLSLWGCWCVDKVPTEKERTVAGRKSTLAKIAELYKEKLKPGHPKTAGPVVSEKMRHTSQPVNDLRK
jgi:hypothetical protein